MLFVTNLRQWQPMFFGEVMKTKKIHSVSWKKLAKPKNKKKEVEWFLE